MEPLDTTLSQRLKRRRKSGWDIDRRSIEAEWEAALLQIPDEILREEIAFWSWSDTPEGEQWIEISDKLDVVLKDVGIDPEERKLIWPDAIRFYLDQSIRRINKQYPCFSEDTFHSQEFGASFALLRTARSQSGTP